MKKQIVFLVLFFSFISSYAQTLVLRSVLSNRLKETSGIIMENINSFWTHNDSGDGNIIFEIDSNGVLVDSVTIDSATHIDYEDITKDNSGNYYIGDCGNNPQNRTNLVIYKIPNPSLALNNKVVAQKIFFNYPDQATFPDTNKNVDCEAIIHLNNKLYLFTKNHGTSGYCKVYELPDIPGNYAATLIDSILLTGMITAADISPNGTLALLEMGRVHLFNGYIGNNFFGGTHTQFPISFSQKEAICFVTEDKIYLTQEHHNYFPSPKLFELSISEALSIVKIKQKTKTNIFPNPVSETLNIKIKNFPKGTKKIKIKIFDTTGKIVLSGKYPKQKKIKLSTFTLKKGSYFVQIKMKKFKVTMPFIKN